MRGRFSEYTGTLAFGAVYGLAAFVICLDVIASSTEPVKGWTLLLFLAATLMFVGNIVMLLWSMIDPDGMLRFMRRW